MDDGHGLRLDILGHPVEIVGPEPMLARVRHQWTRCTTSAPAVRTIELLTWLDADTRESALTSGLNLLGIQLTAPTRLNLHAAGLSDEAGRVVALVARGGTGKTTAARVLGQRLGYVTDECVSVDPATLGVLPYPKPLSLVTGADIGAHPAPKAQRSPDDLRLRQPPATLALGAIVLLDRRDEPAAEAALQGLSLLDAVEELVVQTSSTASMAAPLAALARLVNETGGGARLRYRDIEDASGLIVEHLTGREPRVEQFAHLPGADREGLDRTAAPPLAAVPYRDAILVEDEALVMVGDRVVRTRGHATQAWLALVSGQGRAPLAGDDVAVRQLVAGGLLTPPG